MLIGALTHICTYTNTFSDKAGYVPCRIIAILVAPTENERDPLMEVTRVDEPQKLHVYASQLIIDDVVRAWGGRSLS